MTIRFYLKNEEETPITSFHDFTSNPFSLEDRVHLSVDFLFSIDYKNFCLDAQKTILAAQDKLIDTFGNKTIRLVEENKYVNFKELGDSKLIIEYHCVIED